MLPVENFSSERVLHALSPLYTRAEEMASYYIQKENKTKNVSENPSYWGSYNTNLHMFEIKMRPVLNGLTMERMAVDTRKAHGRIVSLNIGSSNNPLEDIMQPGDILVSMALQDDRTEEKKAQDAQKGIFLIAGTVGIPQTWTKSLDHLLTELKEQNRIEEKAFNIILGDLGEGWYSLPLNQTFVNEYETSNNIIDKGKLQVRKEMYDLYKCWFANQIWNVTSPQGASILMAFQYTEGQYIFDWLDSTKGKVQGECIGNEIFLTRTPLSPENLGKITGDTFDF